MSCEYCNGRGYTEDVTLLNTKEGMMISPCPKCNDIEAYSKAIKEKFKPNTDVSKQMMQHIVDRGQLSVGVEQLNGKNIIVVDFRNKTRR